MLSAINHKCDFFQSWTGDESTSEKVSFQLSHAQETLGNPTTIEWRIFLCFSTIQILGFYLRTTKFDRTHTMYFIQYTLYQLVASQCLHLGPEQIDSWAIKIEIVAKAHGIISFWFLWLKHILLKLHMCRYFRFIFQLQNVTN